MKIKRNEIDLLSIKQPRGNEICFPEGVNDEQK